MRYTEWRRLPSHELERIPNGQILRVPKFTDDAQRLPPARTPEPFVVTERRSSSPQSKTSHVSGTDALHATCVLFSCVIGLGTVARIVWLVWSWSLNTISAGFKPGLAYSVPDDDALLRFVGTIAQCVLAILVSIGLSMTVSRGNRR